MDQVYARLFREMMKLLFMVIASAGILFKVIIQDCTALVMAGGESRRMGQDKANLILGGKSLLQTVAGTMEQIFPEVIVSVCQLRPAMNWLQVCDFPDHRGPLAGLFAGLQKAETRWVFAVACDMPFIKPQVINCLSCYRNDVEAVVPLVQGYPQPLAAFYAKENLAVVSEILHRSSKQSFRELLDQLKVCYVTEDKLRDADPSLQSFRDLDTPEDVRSI